MTNWLKKFQKGSEMYFMFQDFWNLVQDYWNMENTGEYWDAMTQACGEFSRKYHTYFSVKLMQVFVDEQERKRKGLPDDVEICFHLEQETRINAKKEHV